MPDLRNAVLAVDVFVRHDPRRDREVPVVSADAAGVLRLVERGWHVFPVDSPELSQCAGIGRHHDRATCTDRGKHPCVPWTSKASTDPQDVLAWFTGYPRNVGIACGPSGLLVIDEDVPGGLEKVAAEMGQTLPETFTVSTGRGRHFYFAANGHGIGNATGLKGYGIDVRGRGGYVVGPGSLHASGASYVVTRDVEPAALPPWLVEAVTAPQQPSTTDATAQPRSLDGVPAFIAAGQRHNRLASYAGSLRACNVPLGEAEELFRVAFDRCEQPPADPMSWGEALAILRDIYDRYPPGESYDLPRVTVLDEPDTGGGASLASGFIGGGSFILDTPPDPTPLWGRGSEVLLPDGEALIIAAPQGLGKTTLAEQLALGRCGIPGFGTLLGYPIVPGSRRTLYLAMDRPRQAARSFRRMVGEDLRALLDDRLVIWPGPPPGDFAKFHGLLATLCRKADADTVIIDSLKDAAIGLNDDETGAGYNRARQTAIADGVQVVELHHNRKTQQGAKATATIDDVYGSTWLTSGVGSVILLSGAPGDAIVQFRHVKQPADEVGPLRIIHDHTTGRSTVFHAVDLLALAQQPVSAVDAARALFETDKPTLNDKERARRRLEKATREGLLRVDQQGDKTANKPTLWVAV